MFEIEFAVQLKKLRLENNLTQKQVAKYLCVSRTTYTYYELAKTEPNLQSVKKLAELYKIPLSELIK